MAGSFPKTELSNAGSCIEMGAISRMLSSALYLKKFIAYLYIDI